MPSKRPPWLWIGLAGVVLVALIAAVVASSGGSTAKAAPGVEETRPVTVTGNPLPALPDSGTDPAIGQVAPTLTGATFDGTPLTIGNDGKAKLVLFVAHWCPHCQREVPLLVTYLKSHTLPAGVELLTVATATNASQPNYPPSTWLQKAGWTAPVLADSADGTAAAAYGLPGFPYLVGLDASGKVVGRITGEFTTDTFASLAQAVAGG
ncbi:MAG: Redoxin [Acidimicrobiales bacterium]|nr:Redoxin [Acidimicrobiales bacterium]